MRCEAGACSIPLRPAPRTRGRWAGVAKNFAITCLLACVLGQTQMGCSREAREERRARQRAAELGAPSWVLQHPGLSELPGAGPFPEKAWFRAQWINGRLHAWTHRDSERGAVVFVGDSITARWSRLPTEFPGLKVANRGIPSDTSRGVAFRLREDVLALNPTRLVMLIGINDLLLGATPEMVLGNLELMLTQCQEASPAMPIVVCQVLPVGPKHAAARQRIRELNRLMQSLPRRFKAVVLCDTWTPFADETGGTRAAEFPDDLHPGPLAYGRLASILRPCLGLSNTRPPLSLEPARAGASPRPSASPAPSLSGATDPATGARPE